MKKLIILIFSFILISCGSVKKEKFSIDTEKKTESNSGSNTARWINSNNYTLEPIDLSQPMTFTNSKGEKETHTNTKVVYKNSNTHEIIHDTIVRVEKIKEEIDVKEKETDNNQIWLYVILGIAALIYLKK